MKRVMGMEYAKRDPTRRLFLRGEWLKREGVEKKRRV